MTMKVATVLITGASSGIGLELAHVFAEHGDNLVLVARDSSRLTKLAKTLSNQYGLRVEAICLDLTKPDAIGTLVKTLKDEDIRQLSLDAITPLAYTINRYEIHYPRV